MAKELGKRVLDVSVGLILGITFLPVLLIVPIIIKLTSHGPVFYGQTRVGKKGKKFTLYKFRSMVKNADDILARDKSLQEKFKKSDWKLDMKDDPRITRFGLFIRTFTIDEFPQLWNVLKGEMSIVGPRAYRPQEIEEQLEKHPMAKSLMKDVFRVKPGITGPWQTSGRNVIPFIKRVKMDAKYGRFWNLWEDVKTILKTPKAMISRW